ncbi:TetR/AcrR family transcriptional regulator [Geodermatophilus sp. TF02-6]|uniref:TetR/AcrR family transcriptional regulator n=1 Tax=Geodermatophilus sp. TF02-6 TaxID=2250575 RepID=UPI0018F540F0|nr:TetR/AcrR family transcriptional regulator [Geodermatophilus sp. TF02-6]
MADGAPAERRGYPRATGSERGLARRRELLDRIADDVAAHGLGDFSLRRAARVAGTTHKVLLYHFDSVESLLAEVVRQLRERRIDRGLAAAAARERQGGRTLAERIRAIWPALLVAESQVLDQAIGLSMVDPARYADLGRGASQQYLPSLVALCPPHWSERRKVEVAEMVLATLRGFLIDRRVSESTDGVAAGFAALARALDREEADDPGMDTK